MHVVFHYCFHMLFPQQISPVRIHEGCGLVRALYAYPNVGIAQYGEHVAVYCAALNYSNVVFEQLLAEMNSHSLLICLCLVARQKASESGKVSAMSSAHPYNEQLAERTLGVMDEMFFRWQLFKGNGDAVHSCPTGNHQHHLHGYKHYHLET